MATKKRVAYFYDPDIATYYFGREHPMMPHRSRVTHDLVCAYGLDRKMTIISPSRCTATEFTKYHGDEYVKFLEKVNPSNCLEEQWDLDVRRFHCGSEECPIFDGLFSYCQSYTGASIAGAVKLNHDEADICINWAGGMHHARRTQASGHCYINDAVLSILELLKYHARVLYIDIDHFHGDGVEEAFYCTNRVMTVSLHKHGDCFPGTGSIDDVGEGLGKNYALNVPLKDGITDGPWIKIFEDVMGPVVEQFAPAAIVMQCGASGLAADRLGSFNLTQNAYSAAVGFVCQMGKPTLLLGGGGYSLGKVARCWTAVTAAAVGEELSPTLPRGAASNNSYDYFGPSYTLAVDTTDAFDMNTEQYLESVRRKALAVVNEQAAMAPAAKRQRMENGGGAGAAGGHQPGAGGAPPAAVEAEVERRLNVWMASMRSGQPAGGGGGGPLLPVATVPQQLQDEQRAIFRGQVVREEQTEMRMAAGATVGGFGASAAVVAAQLQMPQAAPGGPVVGARLPAQPMAVVSPPQAGSVAGEAAAPLAAAPQRAPQGPRPTAGLTEPRAATAAGGPPSLQPSPGGTTAAPMQQ